MAYKVCVVGSGNWGTAIARIIGENVKQHKKFAEMVNMYVYEELIDGRKLSEIINTEHENVKYLNGYKIPHNVVAVPNLLQAVQDSNLLVFVLPHQFINGICKQIKSSLPKNTMGISLIKGFDCRGSGIDLISKSIAEQLDINMSVLMGANIAKEVADGNFCEATIGSTSMEIGTTWKDLFNTNYFRINVVEDVHTVELCGALKNIVAVGSGFVMGLCHSDNTRAAMIRLGLREMIKFAKTFYSGVHLETFFESCGIADLITTCNIGRNQRVAEAFATTGKPIEQLEKEMLNGQHLQGPLTAKESHVFLKENGMVKQFPIFTCIYEICYEGKPVNKIFDSMREAHAMEGL